MQEANLRIAIVGAGIGGLAAANLIADQGHAITVFDQFKEPKPVGSGLVIQPVGLEVLDHVGVGERVRQMGNPIARMLGEETESGHRVLDVSYGDQCGLAIHRASLFHALYTAVTSRNIDVQSDCKVTAREGQSLITADKRFGPFDLIVDAAGARSKLSPLTPRRLRYGAIWGTVDWPTTGLPMSELRQKYRRANRMLGVLPIGTMPGESTLKTAIFWSMPSDSYSDWLSRGLDAWKDEATTLWPEFAPFVSQITSAEQMTMARYAHGTLRRPYGPGIVHIGDSAHCASPQLGQGANMALLDAFALSRAIAHHPLDQALPAYAMARRWHVRTYQWMSAAFTPQYQSDSRWLPVLRDKVLFPLSQLWPASRILTRLVSGSMLPPLASLTPGPMPA